MVKIVKVPKGIRYISEWQDIGNYISLDFPFILDKQVCGCGMSSYYLWNNENIVLISPRLQMIETKLKDERNNNILSFERYKQDKKKVSNISLISNFKTDLENKLNKGEVIKIIVSYDSFYLIKSILKEKSILSNFRFIVDEMQCLIKDSAFKGETEKDFINELKGLSKLVFLSATVPPKEILNQIDILKDIEIIKLQFDKDDLRVINFYGQILSKDQTFSKLVNQFYQDYKTNGYFFKKQINGNIYFCDELVIFISNIKEICHIINLCKLTSNEVDVICSGNPQTKAKLKKLTNLSPSKIKGKGEKGKLFTFVTKAAFEGADFFSECAVSIIFANPSIDSMVIDISSDLQQIIGRQRLKSNVFKNDVYLYSFSNCFNGSYEELKETKMRMSAKDLNDYNQALTETERNLYKKRIKKDKFETSYLDVYNDRVVYCDLYILAEQWCEQIRKDLVSQKQFYTLRDFKEGDLFNNYGDEEIKIKNQFLNSYKEAVSFDGKLKVICEFLELRPEMKGEIEKDSRIENFYFCLYEKFGYKKLKAKLFRKDLIEPLLQIDRLNEQVKVEIIKQVKVGDKNTLSYYKDLIKNIYNQFGIKEKPKASLMKRYFEVKDIKVNRCNRGFEIIRLI